PRAGVTTRSRRSRSPRIAFAGDPNKERLGRERDRHVDDVDSGAVSRAKAEQGKLPRLLRGDAEADVKVEPGVVRARPAHRVERPAGDDLAGTVAKLEVTRRLEETRVSTNRHWTSNCLADTGLQGDDVGGQAYEAWWT